MGYVESSLVPGEKIVARAKLHWFMVLRSMAWTLFWLFGAAIVIGIAGWIGDEVAPFFTPNGESAPHPKTGFWIGRIIRGIAGLWSLLVVWGHISFWLWLMSTEYAVTDRRVLMKEGLIRRSTFEVQLHQLETVGVHQGLIGRMLGFGSVTLSATGGSRGTWHYIALPMRFKKYIESTSHRTTSGANAGRESQRAEPTTANAAPESEDDGPGRFRVTGVNKDSREDALVEVNASSPANAKVKCELDGMVVTGVERIAPGVGSA